MANIIPVARKLTADDFTPNYDFQLQGVVIDEEEAAKQKAYLKMFLDENTEILSNNTSNMSIEEIGAYIKGAKDAIALVNLWIDSLNVQE